ncbi:hypothetical protein Emag_004840 [Eimeria magna]
MAEAPGPAVAGAPPLVPLGSLTSEALGALKSFEVGLRCIDSSSACIQGLAAAFVHAANTPAVYYFIAAIERQIAEAAAAPAAAAPAAAAAAAQGSAAAETQLVLLLYMLNDVLQRCCSCGVPFLLQLCCKPLQSLCTAAAAAAAANKDEVSRVIFILRQRGTFGGPQICDALLKTLKGQQVDIPPVPRHLLLLQPQQQQQQQPQQQQHQHRPVGGRSAEPQDGRQQTLQRLAEGEDIQPPTADPSQQEQTHLTNAKARIARLYEKQWNKTVQLQVLVFKDGGLGRRFCCSLRRSRSACKWLC